MRRCIYFIIVLLVFRWTTTAQSILIDKGVRVDGLWCFPLVDDSLTFKYLPNQAQMAVDEYRKPKFSFIRYVNGISSDNQHNQLTTGNNQMDGGAVLHFLVNYSTNESMVLEAERTLQNKFFNPKIKISGPIIFDKGTYTLVSTVTGIAENDENKPEYLMMSGSAPVIEGSNIAISIELNKEQGKLLYESFKMPTPDISILFDMTFKGMSSAYNAELYINWSSYYKHEEAGGSVGIYGSGAEVERAIEENFKNQSIVLKSTGEDAQSESLLSAVYQKLISLLYDEVPAQADETVAGLNEIEKFSKSISSMAQKLMPYSATIKYKKKNIKRAGESIISFNSKSTVTKNYTIAFNIGNMFKKYGDNPDFFKSVSLEDPDYNRRDITVTLDGELEPEFVQFINSVTVQMSKTHENNEKTVREIKITKANIGKINNLVLSYGALSDKDKLAWLAYDYRILYEFVGGKKYETPWQSQSNSIINVYVPFERKQIELSGEQNLLESKKIKALVVILSYDLFGQTYSQQKTIRPKDLSQNLSLTIMVPKTTLNYTYKITYIHQDGIETTQSNSSSSEILFLDNNI